MQDEQGLPAVLTVEEVAALFKVARKTVLRWDKPGKLPASFRTLGGHRRYRREDVLAWMKPRAAVPRPKPKAGVTKP